MLMLMFMFMIYIYIYIFLFNWKHKDNLRYHHLENDGQYLDLSFVSIIKKVIKIIHIPNQ